MHTKSKSTDCYGAIFATNLATLRKHKGYRSRKAFAIRMRFIPRTYKSWEMGDRFPGPKSLLRLSEFHEVTINDMLTVAITPDMLAEKKRATACVPS